MDHQRQVDPLPWPQGMDNWNTQKRKRQVDCREGAQGLAKLKNEEATWQVVDDKKGNVDHLPRSQDLDHWDT